MKRVWLLLLSAVSLAAPFVAWAPVSGASPEAASYQVLQIEASISGRSQLILRGETAQWHHLDGVAPGRWDGHAAATIVNGVEWKPTWPDVPDPENRDCNCYSDVFRGVDPALLDLAYDVDLRLVEGRGVVSVVQDPSASNQFTTVLQFDDRGSTGADRYIVEFDLRPLPPVGPRTIRILAHVDGLSRLVLRGDTARWHHLRFAAPGRHFFVDLPTEINGAEWFPTWPDLPDAENRECDCWSSTFHGVSPGVPDRAFTPELRVLRGRGSVSVLEQPTAANDFAIVLEFDDVDPLGPAWYIVEVDVPTAPPLVLLAQRIRDLRDDGVLREGQAQALLVKVEGVRDKQRDERLSAACGQLGAFDHQVEAWHRARILSGAEARQLLELSALAADRTCSP